MCGIYGVIRLEEDRGPINREPIAKMLACMGNIVTHRGPDDSGQYCGIGVGLGMRRLSIIDVAGGHQPVCNEDETVWVVCNGEIYNFKELRSELEASGHIFRSGSDTEVIVHLYEKEGLEFLKRLRGMFALALWDAKRFRLILSRDRLGKKPLYVNRRPDSLIFASEIKSLLEVEGFSRKLNIPALQEYLALGYVPAPLTLFDGIEKLLPGHYLIIERGEVLDRAYWDVPVGATHDKSEEEWVEQVREKLFESVRIRMVSDVPLGAFLSGGIDSSAIVGIMAQLSDRPVKTYSIGFHEKDGFYNELPYARIVANAFATDHHEIVVSPDVSGLLPSLIWHLDEPVADSAFVTTFLVSRLASQSVKVILSGVGGDELFGGYRRYLGGNLARYYKQLPKIARTRLIPGILGIFNQDRHSSFKNFIRYADAFMKSAEWGPALQYMSYVTLFSTELQRALFAAGSRQTPSNGFASEIMQSHFGKRGVNGLNGLIYVDLKTSLPDDLLILTDKMTMAASLECRAPFVDQELVELVSGMPDSLKIRGFTMKYLLKKVVKPWVPRAILQRKKRGFGAPLGSWIRKDLSSLVTNLLSETQVKQRGLFDFGFVSQLVAKHRTQEADYTDHILALINLELWCRIFLDGRDYRNSAEMMAEA
jgi:asparagine synthase (glutamine-hydrolysing)